MTDTGLIEHPFCARYIGRKRTYDALLAEDANDETVHLNTLLPFKDYYLAASTLIDGSVNPQKGVDFLTVVNLLEEKSEMLAEKLAEKVPDVNIYKVTVIADKLLKDLTIDILYDLLVLARDKGYITLKDIDEDKAVFIFSTISTI